MKNILIFLCIGAFCLSAQNYPNPFNPSTNIQFSIPATENVNLKIYNMLGQDVATLVSQQLSSGNYKYTWDASKFASGIYLYKLETAEFVQSKKTDFNEIIKCKKAL